jgi:hypothetical protein
MHFDPAGSPVSSAQDVLSYTLEDRNASKQSSAGCYKDVTCTQGAWIAVPAHKVAMALFLSTLGEGSASRGEQMRNRWIGGILTHPKKLRRVVAACRSRSSSFTITSCGSRGGTEFLYREIPAGVAPHAGAFPVEPVWRPGDRMVIELAEGADRFGKWLARLERVLGIAYLAVARPWLADPATMWKRSAARPGRKSSRCRLQFRGARQAQRQNVSGARGRDRTRVGRYLLDHLRAAGTRRARALGRSGIDLPHRDYARAPCWFTRARFPAWVGLPANTAGRMVCLLVGRIRFGGGGL